MRLVLTYALAALACVVALTALAFVLGGLDYAAMTGEDNRARSSAVVDALAFLRYVAAFFAILAPVIWWLGGRVLAAMGQGFAGGAVMLKSFVIWGVVALAALLWDSGPAVLRRLASEATPIVSAFNPLFNSLPVYLGVWIVISLVWGGVFWLRSAAPERAGATA